MNTGIGRFSFHFFSWGARIRTSAYGVRDRCPTTRRLPILERLKSYHAPMIWSNLIGIYMR